MLTNKIRNILKPITDGLTVLITVGNNLRSDDGIGPYIADKLKSTVNYVIFNAGDKPENILDEVIKLTPKKVILIDAADFKGQAGEIRLIPFEQISEIIFSTHTFPLKAIAAIIIKDTNADFHFLGIQPKNTHLSELLSEEVRISGDEIVEYLNRGFRGLVP